MNKYKMLTVLNGGGATTCTFSGLMKYTKYEFFLIPFYKSVEGKPSNLRVAQTMEDGKWNFIYLQYFFDYKKFIFLNVDDDFTCIYKQSFKRIQISYHKLGFFFYCF